MNIEEFLAKVRDSGVMAEPHKPVYGEKISKYITAGVDHIVSPDTGEEWLHAPLLRLFDAAREILGRPLPINAGSRTPAHELLLQSQGYKTAKFVSPHCLSALDVQDHQNTTPEANAEIQAALKEAAENLGMPAPRLGHIAYGEKFTHVDVIFMFFDPYTSLSHPGTWDELEDSLRKEMDGAWRPGIEW